MSVRWSTHDLTLLPFLTPMFLYTFVFLFLLTPTPNNKKYKNTKFSRLECSVCGHTWFQSRDRLIELGDGFEMVPLPESDKQRIAMNIQEGKSPKFTGDAKLYVGNISFGVTEEDLFVAFSDVADVGSVALVRDDQGRNRGFGFITMRTKEGGQAAVEQMNGAELKGRTLSVRESNN